MILVRSVLSVPGSSQRFLDKAAVSDADVVMIDWEDGVAHESKGTARELTSAFLRAAGATDRPVWVRINATSTDHFAKDAAEANHQLDPAIPIVLPMSTLATTLAASTDLKEAPLIAMIETAQGVEESADIVRLPRVIGLMFGEYDFLATTALTGAARFSDTSWAKSRLINAATAAGKWTIAGPNADFSDPAKLQEQSASEAGLGFSGKLCIHPNQIETINTEFGPAPEYVSWARDLLNEMNTGNHQGAFRFRGQMVDAPVIDRARAAVRLAGVSR